MAETPDRWRDPFAPLPPPSRQVRTPGRLHHARIELRDLGGHTTGEVEIDGARIESGLFGLTLTAGTGQPPRLELNGAIAEFDEVGVELRGVRYGMSKYTREALIELGWTPPAGEDETDG